MVLLLLLVTLIGGCMPVQSVPPADAPPPDPTDATTADATPQASEPPSGDATATPALEGVLIVYHKSGCFAGVDLTLTVHDDGRLVLVDRDGTQTERQVAPAELETLRTLLADPAWAQVRSLYQAAGADLCVYAFTIPIPDAAPREVTTMDAAMHPDIVEELRIEMERLLDLAS